VLWGDREGSPLKEHGELLIGKRDQAVPWTHRREGGKGEKKHKGQRHAARESRGKMFSQKGGDTKKEKGRGAESGKEKEEKKKTETSRKKKKEEKRGPYVRRRSSAK